MVDCEQRNRDAVVLLGMYLEEHPDQIEEAAEYTGFISETVKKWISGGSTLGGITTLLIEGFLRAKGALDQIVLNDPPTIVQALEKGLSERCFTEPEVREAVGLTDHRGVLRWVIKGEIPKGGPFLWRLEHFLAKKGLRPSSLRDTLTPEAQLLYDALCEDKQSVEDIVVALGLDPVQPKSHDRIRDWVSGRARPLPEIALVIQERFGKKGAVSRPQSDEARVVSAVKPRIERPRGALQEAPIRQSKPENNGSPDVSSGDVLLALTGALEQLFGTSLTQREMSSAVVSVLSLPDLEELILAHADRLEILFHGYFRRLGKLPMEEAKAALERLRARAEDLWVDLDNSIDAAADPYGDAYRTLRRERR
ncbi:MAG: hypothetical protein BWY68_00603 [bacterium ADurb.Bin400]|nr:MAG: hypothetical protein BWY68_00603 [bacterium ADurb.Bin400]